MGRLVAVAVGAMVLNSVAGCAPDGRSSDTLPGAVVDAFTPDSLRSRSLGDGVQYHFLWSGAGPFAVHLVEMPLDRCDLDLDVALPEVDGSAGLGQVTAMVATAGRSVRVAVNGDFFTAEGRPLGPTVRRGVVELVRERPGFAWRSGGESWIGSVGVGGARVSGPDWLLDDPGEVDVVGGFPELLDDGERVGDLGVGSNPTFAAARHPRTAIAVDRAGGRLWLVVVDGRQGEYSMGMTLPELATLVEALGATEALNLDGGGSSVMVIDGEIVSRPSDAGGERAVANALLLVSDPAGCTR